MRDATLAGTKLDRYFHVCALFNSRDEEYPVLGPFFKEGLDWGEKVLNIVDPALYDDHVQRLREQGIDVDALSDKGQYQCLPWDQVYLQDGAFDQQRMLDAIDTVITAGEEQGYPRSRIMGNMGWAFCDCPGSDQLIEFEARVNEVLVRRRHPAVCVYDVHWLDGQMVMDILRSHPFTLVGGVVHENPFYTPPEILLRELKERKEAAA